MKSVYKLCFSALLGILLCFVCITTAHAFNEIDSVTYDGSGFEVGDSIVYYCRNQYADGGFVEVYVRNGQTVFQDGYDKYMCFYLEENPSANGGYSMKPYNVIGFTESYYNAESENTFVNEAVGYGGQDVPWEYMDNGETCTSTVAFFTNIPIFLDKATADAYHDGEEVSTQAINYNKEYSGGSWVKPFEDIEINDSNIPIPNLSNVSHEGFKVDDITYDYDLFIDIYVESGIQNPFVYVGQNIFGTEPPYTNVYGLVSDMLETPINQSYINLISDFGINNVENLNSSKNSFYQTYPCAIDFYNGADMLSSKFHKIWGQPFAKPFVFWSVTTDVTQSEYSNLSVNNMPLCYTNYKVRYYYYSEEDGMHFGPWCSVTYYSDGRVEKNSIYEDNNGNIIDTPIENGTLDDDGNITIGTGTNIELGDFDNPNELFGYLRSIINNVDATTNSFTALFSAFFTVIPAEIQVIMWLSIALMCFGSIILWVWRK